MIQMSAKEYREQAATYCKPQSGTLAIIYLIYAVIVSAISSAFGQFKVEYVVDGQKYTFVWGETISTIVMVIIGGAFTFGLISVARTVRKGKKVEVEQLFSGFKEFTRSFVLNLLLKVYIFLWSLLLIIPGIIKAYSYSMSFYIALDNKDMSASECINKSKELMNGHKAELFRLHLSYIGWLLLCLLTLGILSLWVFPKMKNAEYEFYLNLTDQIKIVNVPQEN